MAIALRATAAFNSGLTTTADVTFTIPAATVAGDVIYVFVGRLSNTTCTSPAGWTDLGAANSASGISGSVHRKVAQSGDAGTSVTFTLGAPRVTAALMRVYSGADTTTPEDATTTTNFGNDAAPTALGLTTVTAAAESIVLYSVRDTDTTATWVTPTDYTDGQFEHTIAVGDNDATAAWDRSIVTAGATGNVATSLDSGLSARWVAFQVAIKPAASGPAIVADAAVLTADGSVTVAGFATTSGASALIAASTLTAAGQATTRDAASLTADGTIAAAASVTVKASASLSADGTLAASTGSVKGAAAMTADATLTASAAVLQRAAASMSASGSAMAAARLTMPTAAILSGEANLTASAQLATFAAAQMAGDSTLTASVRALAPAGATPAERIGTVPADSRVTSPQDGQRAAAATESRVTTTPPDDRRTAVAAKTRTTS